MSSDGLRRWPADPAPPEPKGHSHRVPDLQLDLLVVDCDHPSSKFDANGEVVHLLEALVGKLQQQARFAHAGIADDDVPDRCSAGVMSPDASVMHSSRRARELPVIRFI